ncbi:MAG: FANCL C-terminal domain-containing protein [Monoraphidium minutum]|nr:MAG: FANCL C-terminal domain-containing protein [Monoraphidium minutum]
MSVAARSRRLQLRVPRAAAPPSGDAAAAPALALQAEQQPGAAGEPGHLGAGAAAGEQQTKPQSGDLTCQGLGPGLQHPQQGGDAVVQAERAPGAPCGAAAVAAAFEPPLCCAAELLDALPLGALARLAALPPGARPCDVLRELEAAAGGALQAVPAPWPAQWRRQQEWGDVCCGSQYRDGACEEGWGAARHQPGAWQVPLLPPGAGGHPSSAPAGGDDRDGGGGGPPPMLLLAPLAGPDPSGGGGGGFGGSAGSFGAGHGNGGGGGGEAGGGGGCDAAFQLALLQQVDALGWGCVVALSQDLTRLALQLPDAAGRHHLLHVQLPRGFPAAAPAAWMDLPEPFAFPWGPGANSLAALARHARQALARYQELWDTLEQLEGSCRVVDPPQPRAAAQQALREWAGRGGGGAGGGGNGVAGAPGWFGRCGRRLALPRGAGCLELSLPPAAPRSLPSATFSGGGAAAAELQRRWFACAAAAWAGGAAPAANLETVLQVELPPPSRQQLAWLEDLRRPLPALGAAGAACSGAAGGGEEAARDGGGGGGGDAMEEGGVSDSDEDSSDDEDDAGACGICYSVLLKDPSAPPDHPGDVPDASCDSQGGCGRPFHARCLAEWLRGLPNSRRVFATLFGACPYCSAPVAVRA